MNAKNPTITSAADTASDPKPETTKTEGAMSSVTPDELKGVEGGRGHAVVDFDGLGRIGTRH